MSPLKDFLIILAGAALLGFMMVLMVSGAFALFGP